MDKRFADVAEATWDSFREVDRHHARAAVAELAALFATYAAEVPRAPKDTVSEWHPIGGSRPAIWERVYVEVPDLVIGNITQFQAGFSWVLIVNGRILRQSQLLGTLEEAQRTCDDLRDRIVAMWNA